MKMLKKALAMMLVLVMVFSCASVAFAAQRVTAVAPKTSSKGEKTMTSVDKLPGDLEGLKDFQLKETRRYADDDVVTAIVVMEGAATIDVADNGTTKAAANEARLVKQHNTLKSAMKTAGIDFTVQFEYVTLLNGLAISVAYGDLNKIAAMDGVSSVHIANTYDAPVVEPTEKNAYANQMTGAALLHDAGYKGEGTIVAVLDTGTRVTHEAFQDYGITAEDGLTKAQVEATETIGTGAYLSAKIPFACDYAGKDVSKPTFDADVTDYNGHGTHVAGSAVGYVEEEDGAVTFSGAAPAAQLLAMKIFGDETSSTTSAVYLAAIEDAYRLGADVISMSIGAQNGFTYDEELEDEVFGNIYAKMEEKGVIMSIAAGNEGAMGDYSNNWVGSAVLGSYADYGVVGTPSTYGNNVSVAAIENIAYPASAITVGEEKISYSDASDNLESSKLVGKDFEYVMVPGYGAEADYANVDVTGKVAVVSRGDITFSEKEVFAYQAGAAALIVYNNAAGVINMAIDQYDIPAVSVTQEAGEILANAEEKTLHFDEEKAIFENSEAWLACTFSSMGTTSELAFKPSLASIGGNVNSASVSGDGNYEVMSGTSMATPNASGNFAQLTQYANELYMESECYAEKFTDVNTDLWYHEAIDFVVSQGMVVGITETTFGPNLNLTRGQMVTILYRQAGKPSVAGKTHPFVDVPASEYYSDAITWAYNNDKIVSGTDDTHFAPKANITRQDLVSILWRSAGRPDVTTDYLKDYTDKDTVKDYAVAAVNWAISKRIITSMSTESLIISAKSNATRAQFARMMMVYLDGSYSCTGITKYLVNRAEFVKDLAESTALTLTDNDYQLYSPRKQGAGLFNVAAAVTADAYIPSPLLELGDDAERTGVYDLSFDVVSLSDETTYYEIDPWTLVDASGVTEDGQYYNLMTSSYTDATFTTNYEDNILVLEAGATAHVEITITLDEETVAHLEESFENGGFVEGYAFLWQLEKNEEGEYVDAESGNYIHASFLGFYGDWTQAPILETYDFADAIDADDFLNNTDAGDYFGNSLYRGYSLADLGFTYFDLLEMDTDINFAFLATTKDGVPTGLVDYLGGAVYAYGEQNDAYNAISNGASETGHYDSDMVYTLPTQLRNARHMIMTVTDAKTGELYYVNDSEYMPKAAYDADYAMWMQQGEYYWDGKNYMADEPTYLANGTQVNINYYANLPYGEDELGAIDYEDLLTKGQDYLEWNFSLTIDNVDPVLDPDYELTEDGLLTVTASDDRYLATVVATNSDFDILDVALSEAKPGESATYTLDLGDYTGDIYVMASDYATNYALGVIEGEGGNGSEDEDSVYEWVFEIGDDMSDEYAITGYNGEDLFLLNASAEAAGTAVGTAAGAINWWDTEVRCNSDLTTLYYVDDSLTWVFEKTTDGYYTIRMKGSDNYLACTADGKLTTVKDATAAEAKWDFGMIEEPVGDGSGQYYALADIVNVGTDLTLLFDSENDVFGCFDASYDDVYNLDVYIKVA